MQATAKIVSNAFHNANYAFALLTLRNADPMPASARRISVANATTHLIVKIGRKMSTIREPLEPKVDVHGCQRVNCCTALLRNSRLAIGVNGSARGELDSALFLRRGELLPPSLAALLPMSALGQTRAQVFVRVLNCTNS